MVALAHAFFAALDANDVAGTLATVDPAFVWFEDGRAMDREALGKVVRGRVERKAPPRTRTWKDEPRIRATPTSTIFIGEAVEHVAAEGDRKAADFDGYDTLVWRRDGAAWRLIAWQWARGGIDAERELWDETFRTGVGFEHQPNQLLVDTLAKATPGRALDLLMGQGRNAIFEASRGWKVTGVDISREGMKLAREEAARRHLAIETVDADVDTWDLGVDRWDLVTMIYAGDSVPLVEKVKPSLRHGGLFVLEYFHADSEAARSGAGGWKTGQLAALFAGPEFAIERDEVVEARADYTLRPQKLVRFVARRR